MNDLNMDKLVNFCKQYGFIFQGSEIYGGLANTWDFGPVGALLKDNIKKAWLKKFVQENEYNVGLDSAILMNPKTWEASGHLKTFSDPLIDCRECKTRHRADKLIDEYAHSEIGDAMTQEEMMNYIRDNKIPCPKCGKSDFTDIRQFNLMFKTFQGVTEDAKSTIYLRPETAQGIFVNFQNVQRSMRLKVPFGIGQVGKSFRNEITPGNFIFRVREFEQMELEFFCKPGTELEWHKFYKDYCYNYLLSLGINKDKLRLRDHSKEELCFYSNATTDIEYLFPFGWGELWGIASRTDYDLTCHQKVSGKNMEYIDPETNERYIPYVIEPSVGVERTILTVLCDAYHEETLDDGTTREVMKFHPFLAPYKACILPLVKKYHSEKAMEIYKELSKSFATTYDESGSIGKRYRREDALGTPYCITIDDETINNGTVTIRDRDTMEQTTIKVEDIDIREMTRKSLRAGYGMVLQETWLKTGTIRENIAMGRPDATEEEIVEAAKASHIHNYIRRLPKGYDTWITEDGGGLSQGQKQLLCIARVMLCRPPMLILDEATSSIDTRTEIKIQQAFAKLMEGRTTFIVAHRLSTIREADVILVMKDGKIIEQGNHEVLMKKEGFYHHLYESQFSM